MSTSATANSSIERRAAKSPGAELRPDPLAHLAQHGVAGRGIVADLVELADVDAQHGDMRALAMHVGERGVEQFVEGVAIGEAGERIVILEIAQALFGAPLLAAPRPGERDRRRDAGAEQEHGDGGDQAEIAGQHLGLLALIEIDEQRPVQMAAHANRNGEHCKVRDGGAGAVVDRYLGVVVALRNLAHFVVELQSRLGAT